MDTLPSSVSSLQVPNYTLAHRKSSDFSRFKPPQGTSHQNLNISNSFVPINKPPSFSQKPISKPSKNTSHFIQLAQSSSTPKQAPLIDVKRFLKLLGNKQLQGFLTDAHVKQSEKGKVVKEIAEKGKFHKHLVVLIRMLVDKTKLGMVPQVLVEFQRLFEELRGTDRFLVPL
ncbi:hypothetical protein DCAR_0103140 [Daucus carota subsp. sativus]|uniref:Uncharacterized protein n=1 Tax=Daucus carota subsp. sativus TaxID=79200 RepID=A0AAF0W725_DAUCS|nr:hypothetical protein DCAR_0103140 [Daucus carota subsp. sativus]